MYGTGTICTSIVRCPRNGRYRDVNIKRIILLLSCELSLVSNYWYSFPVLPYVHTIETFQFIRPMRLHGCDGCVGLKDTRSSRKSKDIEVREISYGRTDLRVLQCI